MDEKEATKLLENTFSHSLSEEQFSLFIKELFKKLDISPQTRAAWSEYQEYINSYQLLGTYKQGKDTIDILTVKLKKAKSIGSARTMQRNFIAKYLNKVKKDAALVAFYSENDPDWRFSFVKMEYHLKEGDKGKTEIETELTPVKRYSFLVGKNEPNYTCKKQFLQLIVDEDKLPSLNDIETAFSIEKVTDEFFNAYQELYLELEAAVHKIIENNLNVRKEFEDKDITSIDFSKKLLGQIVFIYFLQKKGWLGVQRDEKGGFQPWGSGPKKFLRELFDGKIIHYENFFNDILEPLFYEALSTSRTDDYYSKFNRKIPFLNGGLFEPIGDYNWVTTDILIADSIFKDIFDTFDLYNFTIKEDESLEKEVAIDPEMLGKIFENLLKIKDRKSTGSYYTPREIVHYMCQQSLINYIETNTGISRKEIEIFVKFGESISANTNTPILPTEIINKKDEIDFLLKEVKIVDPAVGSGAFPVGMMTEIVKARSLLTPLFSDNEQEKRTDYNLKRETIENCLYGVDIDASAIDIAKLRFWLSLIVDELDMKNIKPLPNLDHKLMVGNSLLEEFEGLKLFDENLIEEPKKNIYAVKQIENEIKKLYFELGEIHKGFKKSDRRHIVEINKELKKLEKNKKNLLTKPKTNDEAVTLEEAVNNRIKQSVIKLNELKNLQKRFFNEHDRESKKKYASQINHIEWELIEETLKEQDDEDAIKKLRQYQKLRSKPFFLWKLYFAEVFQRENPGFDIVIANPPYIRIQKLNFTEAKSLKKNYLVAKGKFDIYTLFYELGFKILREKAILTYISSNSFLTQKFGVGLRTYLKDNQYASKILDFGHNQIFRNASTYTLIFIGKKESLVSLDYSRVLYLGDIEEINLEKFIFKNHIFYDDKFNWKKVTYDVLINKLSQNFEITQKYFYTRSPFFTGMDSLLVKDIRKDKEEFLKENIWREIIKPKEIKRNFILKSSFRVFFPYEINNNKFKLISEKKFKDNYPLTYKYLYKFKEKLLKRKDSGKNFNEIGRPWYALMRVGRPEDYFKDKILTPAIVNKNCFALDTSKRFFPTGGTYGLIQKTDRVSIKYLCPILNSKLIAYFLFFTSIPKRGGYIALSANGLENIPIRNVSEREQKPFIGAFNKILLITNDENYLKNPNKQAMVKSIEEKIDKMVYEHYKLTEEEINKIENFHKTKI